MSNNFKNIFKKNNILSLLIIAIILNMAIFPSVYINATKDGLLAWAINLLPSLLPFMIFVKILTNLKTVETFCNNRLAFLGKIYNTSPLCSFVFAMSILSGYPLGAKMISDLYATRKITSSDACRMASFCVTSGPMFVIGSVGVCMFGSVKIGILIYFSHILGALLNGLIYRNIVSHSNEKNITQTPNISVKEKENFATAISTSTLAILNVGAIICVFFVIITALKPIIILLPNELVPLVEGFIEITKGCLDMTCLPQILQLCFATFCISFGGFSTIMQSMAFLSDCHVKLSTFIIQKVTSAIIATLIAVLLFIII